MKEKYDFSTARKNPYINRLKKQALPAKEDLWKTFLEGLNGFSEDFFDNGRASEIASDRINIFDD